MKTKRFLAALCAFALCAGFASATPLNSNVMPVMAEDSIADEQAEQTIVLDGGQLSMRFKIIDSQDAATGKITWHPIADSVKLYCTALDGNEMTLVGEAEAWQLPNSSNEGNSDNTRGYDVDESKSTYTYDSKYTYIARVAGNGYFSGTRNADYQYDPVTKTWVNLATAVSGGSVFSNEIPISASTFSMLSAGNLTSLVITDSSGNTLHNVNNSTFKKGSEYFDLRYWQEATWEAKYSTTETYDKVTTVTDYTVTGKFAGTIPYVTDTIVDSASSKRDDNTANPDAQKNISPVISILAQSPIDDNGKEVSFDYDITGHGAVELICNGELVEKYTASDFDNGFYQIPNYNAGSSYFLKVAKTEKADDFVYFRFDNSIGKWVFRVDTSVTPFVDMTFDLGNMPYINNDISLLFTSDGDYYGLGKYAFKDEMTDWNFTDVAAWNRADFLAGKATKNEIPTNHGAYYVYTETNASTSKDCMWYRIIGIDVVPIGGVGTISNFACYAPTKSDAGDNVTVEGKNDNGEDVAYSTTQVLNDDTLPLPNGDYTVTDNTSGLVEKVEVVNGTATTVENNADTLNLNEPVYANLFTIKALNGDVIGEGTMKDKSVTADDITVKVSKKLNESGVYAFCESKYGIVNSVKAEDMTTENSYVGIAADSSFLKVLKADAADGDVDADTNVSVLDIVKEQKYISNADSLTFRDFCAADINRDGDVDVFDLALLKREVLTQNSDK